MWVTITVACSNGFAVTQSDIMMIQSELDSVLQPGRKLSAEGYADRHTPAE